MLVTCSNGGFHRIIWKIRRHLLASCNIYNTKKSKGQKALKLTYIQTKQTFSKLYKLKLISGLSELFPLKNSSEWKSSLEIFTFSPQNGHRTPKNHFFQLNSSYCCADWLKEAVCQFAIKSGEGDSKFLFSRFSP